MIYWSFSSKVTFHERKWFLLDLRMKLIGNGRLLRYTRDAHGTDVTDRTFQIRRRCAHSVQHVTDDGTVHANDRTMAVPAHDLRIWPHGAIHQFCENTSAFLGVGIDQSLKIAAVQIGDSVEESLKVTVVGLPVSIADYDFSSLVSHCLKGVDTGDAHRVHRAGKSEIESRFSGGQHMGRIEKKRIRICSADDCGQQQYDDSRFHHSYSLSQKTDQWTDIYGFDLISSADLVLMIYCDKSILVSIDRLTFRCRMNVFNERRIEMIHLLRRKKEEKAKEIQTWVWS